MFRNNNPFIAICGLHAKKTSRPTKRLRTKPYSSRNGSKSLLFDGSQAGNSTEWQNYNLTITLTPAAGQLHMVATCVWLVSLNDGEKESKTQLAPSVKVCSLVSFSILTGHVRLCLVIPRQTTSKQKELTLFTENGLPTMQMTNIKFL